jgi:hypothetical protein
MSQQNVLAPSDMAAKVISKLGRAAIVAAMAAPLGDARRIARRLHLRYTEDC